MPNTLAHLGVQAVLTRGILRDADLKWVFLGCVIPDLPWILQRAIRILIPGVDPIALRLYAIAQATLLVTLLACAGFAALSAAPRRSLAILALNAIAHLLLDASQTKWANGVHLFAPLSWELLSLDLFWPESLPTYLLTAAGLACFVWGWTRRTDMEQIAPRRPLSRRLAPACALFLAYLLVPALLLAGPSGADNHSVATLKEREHRVGREVAFDRVGYQWRGEVGVLRTFTGEEIRVSSPLRRDSGQVSARGVFIREDAVQIRELHWHRYWPRDYLSMLGLLLVALFWLRELPTCFSRKRGGEEQGSSDPVNVVAGGGWTRESRG